MKQNKDKKPRGYWTKERCQEEALKYETRGGFSKNSFRSYKVSLENEWIDEVCSHMISKQNPYRYWTKERCQEEALKYATRTKFHKKSLTAYNKAREKDWLDEICFHMKEIIKPSGYWTYDRCKNEALKYETKTDFLKLSPGANNSSIRNGWYKELCSHMKVCGNNYLKFVYAFEFEDNYAYIGLTYNLKNRESDHLSTENCTIYNHIKKTNSKYNLINLTEKPIQLEEAQELEHKTKLKYIENGWVILNIGLTGRGIGSTGGNNLKWTKEKCIREVSKYKSRKEFRKKSEGAYRSSLRNGWLEEICSHMPEKRKQSGYWIYENCKNEASKYKSRKEFCNNSEGGYRSSIKNGWIDDFFIKKKHINN